MPHFLCHLCLAGADPGRQVGQIAGDFARALVLDELPPAVAAGVRGHRLIDRFTDSHSAVREAKRLLAGPLRRYAGLVLDLYYDHLLARDWAPLTGGSLRADSRAIYASLAAHRALWPPGMRRFGDFLIDSDLLWRLREPSVMADGLARIGGQLRRPVVLAPAIDQLAQAADEHRRLFGRWWRDLRQLTLP